MGSKKKHNVHLMILTRQTVVFEGDVETVSSFNQAGPFDVLEEHTNFISLIKDKIVIRTLEGEKREMPVQEGILRVVGNEVSVFLGLGH